MDKLAQRYEVLIKLLLDWRTLLTVAIFVTIWILLRAIANVGGTPRSLQDRFKRISRKTSPESDEDIKSQSKEDAASRDDG